MTMMNERDWIVRVYNDDDTLNDSWMIKNRTEENAVSEAMSEVEQHYAGLDWSMTESKEWDLLNQGGIVRGELTIFGGSSGTGRSKLL